MSDNQVQGGPDPQRARTELTPRKTNYILLFTNWKEISVNDLNQEQLPLDIDKRYMNLQLLRIVAPENKEGNVRIFNTRKNQFGSKNTNSDMVYTRLFLCRVVSDDNLSGENRKVVYIMVTRIQHTNLWEDDRDQRDLQTIGSLFRILAPKRIESSLGGVPLVCTDLAVVLLNDPISLPAIYLDGNLLDSQAFVINGMTLTLRRTTVCEGRCSGDFCDGQRISELKELKRGCGCYAMPSFRTRLVVVHDIEVRSGDKHIFMNAFSSRKFSSWYLSDKLPHTKEVLDYYHLTPAYTALRDGAVNTVNKVNENGGWTIIGHGRRGIINDKTLTGEFGILSNAGGNNNNKKNRNEDGQSRVASSEISRKIVCVRPTNKKYYEEGTAELIALNALKYNVTS